MRVIGVDPGLSRCGIAVVEGSHHRAAAIGLRVVRTARDLPVENRLAQLYQGLRAVITDTRPQALAVERVLFNANARTAMQVAQATGVVLLCAADAALPVTEYTPTQVKAAVTGHGAAGKAQVAAMVRAHLALIQPPRPADVADALAVALCHLWRAAGGVASGEGAVSPRLRAAAEAASPGAQVVGIRDPAGSTGDRSGRS